MRKSTAAIRNRLVVDAATFASLGDWDFRPMLARLRRPALALDGRQTNVPLEAARVSADVVPNARLRSIPGAGYEIFLDRPAAKGRAPPAARPHRA